MASSEADFVDAARHHASLVSLQPPSRAQALRDQCEREYGKGTGAYHVDDHLRDWFDENDDLREKLDQRTARAWDTSFIELLKRAAGHTDGGGALRVH